MLKEFSVNVLLVKDLEQMPCHAKFIKDLTTAKRTVSFELIDNVHHCSEIVSPSLVNKKEYP